MVRASRPTAAQRVEGGDARILALEIGVGTRASLGTCRSARGDQGARRGGTHTAPSRDRRVRNAAGRTDTAGTQGIRGECRHVRRAHPGGQGVLQCREKGVVDAWSARSTSLAQALKRAVSQTGPPCVNQLCRWRTIGARCRRSLVLWWSRLACAQHEVLMAAHAVIRFQAWRRPQSAPLCSCTLHTRVHASCISLSDHARVFPERHATFQTNDLCIFRRRNSNDHIGKQAVPGAGREYLAQS